MTLMTVVTGRVAFTVTVALWGLSFGRAARVTLRYVEETSNPIHAVGQAGNVLTVMVAGLVAVAVANEEVIGHPHEAISVVLRVLLFGGPVLFLLAEGWYIRVVTSDPATPAPDWERVAGPAGIGHLFHVVSGGLDLRGGESFRTGDPRSTLSPTEADRAFSWVDASAATRAIAPDMSAVDASPVCIATTDGIAGTRIVTMLGVAVGIAIRSRGVGGNIMAGFDALGNGSALDEFRDDLAAIRREALAHGRRGGGVVIERGRRAALRHRRGGSWDGRGRRLRHRGRALGRLTAAIP